MYLSAVVEEEDIREVLGLLGRLYSMEEQVVRDLSCALQPYRMADELEPLFWWLNYAEAKGIEKAEHFYPALLMAISDANTYFVGMLTGTL